jgi:hypothetical protein
MEEQGTPHTKIIDLTNDRTEIEEAELKTISSDDDEAQPLEFCSSVIAWAASFFFTTKSSSSFSKVIKLLDDQLSSAYYFSSNLLFFYTRIVLTRDGELKDLNFYGSPRGISFDFLLLCQDVE